MAYIQRIRPDMFSKAFLYEAHRRGEERGFSKLKERLTRLLKNSMTDGPGDEVEKDASNK